MLGELKEGEIVFQLAILDNAQADADGKLQITVNDENGQPTKPMKFAAKDFDAQFRPWGGFKNVFVRAVQILSFEDEGRLVKFQRLDKNNKPVGDPQQAQKRIFITAYLMENQINVC